LGWQEEELELQEVQLADTVGPAMDPHMPDVPASHAGGGGHPESTGDGGGGVTGDPAHAFPSGTHTLTCWPLNVVSIEQVRPLGHVLPTPHAGAQNESPWNWAQTSPPVQSVPVTQAGHSADPGPDTGKTPEPPAPELSRRWFVPSNADAQPADQPPTKPANTVIEPRTAIEMRTVCLLGESTSREAMSGRHGSDHQKVFRSSQILQWF
jgi:hypothetical protein